MPQPTPGSRPLTCRWPRARSSRPLPLAEATRLAYQSAQRAIALDETLAEAWTTLGKLKMNYEWDWQGAEADLDHAMALAPDDVDTLMACGRFLSATGQHASAINVLNRARTLEPARRETLEFIGQACWYAGRIEPALAAFAGAIALPPPEKRAYFRRMLLLDQVGRHDEAMADRCMWLQICGELATGSRLRELEHKQRMEGSHDGMASHRGAGEPVAGSCTAVDGHRRALTVHWTHWSAASPSVPPTCPS